MLSPSRNAGRCIYCAFRTHQLHLQSLRLRGQRPLHIRTTTASSTPLIRFTGRDRSSPHDRAFDSRTAVAEQKGRIRRVYRREGQYEGPDFISELQRRLLYVKDELANAPLLDQLRKEKEDSGENPESFEKLWRTFTAKVIELGDTGPRSIQRIRSFEDTHRQRLIKDLRDAFKLRGVSGLDDRIKYAFYGHLVGSRFTASDIKNQQSLADLRYPSEWFPATRTMHRTIHLHVGPTNSGKTYHALQRLEAAQIGVYAGPLRLLAHEVYTRMNAKGKPCALITGEERRMADKENNKYGDMSACTVEMMPLNRSMDVAVIDEIQMIGNKERGWAWTQGLLGVKAREVHLCGEERAVPMIREICASLGEKLEIHRYERLSPLKVAEESLDGKLSELRKGDCIVSFSVMGIHALRKQIESVTGRKVATVYGSLPPETRAQQARLFNDPNNEYDYLVASDAVGMGLNLAIKRIIFEASNKYDGVQRRTLGVADIKQIAGRAGRYRVAGQQAARDQSAQETENKNNDIATEPLSAAKGEVEESSPASAASPEPEPEPENVGIVTTLEKFDFPIVCAAMTAEPEPIRTAGIFPPSTVLQRFASYFPPSTPFSYILTRLHELSQMHPRFHLCGLKDQVWIADLIEPVKGLTVSDRNIICSSPASKTDVELWRHLMPAYARIIANQSGGDIIDIKELPLEILEAEVSASREYLHDLEKLHKGIVTYLWLSYRFAGIFGTRSTAFYVKGLVEEKIEGVLGRFSFSEGRRRAMREKRERELVAGLVEEEGEGVVGDVEGEEYDGVGEEGEVRRVGEPQLELERKLQSQTTLTSGGDHFAGEEDLGLHEPGEEDNRPPTVRNYARAHSVEENDVDTPLSGAAAEGEEAGLEAARRHTLESATEDRLPGQAASDLQIRASFTNEAMTPELEAHNTVEEDLPQQSPPMPRKTPAKNSKFGGGGVPPKHLAHLDVDTAEVEERNWASRP